MIFTNPSGAPELACDECGCRWFDRVNDACYECGAPVTEAMRREFEEALARFACEGRKDGAEGGAPQEPH
jgi:ribosomal protein L37E